MINTVLIGTGMVAKTHVNAITATNGNIQLKGVLGRDSDRTRAFVADIRRTTGTSPDALTSISDITNDPGIDFVIVATPPDAREELCQALCDAGKPVLMEKPVERNANAATTIVSKFDAAGLPLGIVFQHRTRESAKLLRRLISGGTLGEIAVAELAIPWWREQAYYDEPGRGTYQRDGGGVLISQAIHTLDLALNLLGPVKTVQAITRTTSLHSMESEDYVCAGLDFASGATGSLVASTASYPGSAESIVLHCSHASVQLKSGQLNIRWRSGKIEVLGETTNTGGGADPMAFTHAWHQSVIEDFADAIVNDRPPMATGQDALEVHYLIDALVESSRLKKAITVFGRSVR